MKGSFSKKRTLILGHNGFIGKHLCNTLQLNCPDTDLIVPSERILFQDKNALTVFLNNSGADCVFYLAHDRQLSSQQNLESTRSFFEVLLEVKPDLRVVLPGSAAEYGVISPSNLPVTEDTECFPVTEYGIFKKKQNQLVMEYSAHGLNLVTGRIFNTIGTDAPRHTLIGSFFSKIKTALSSAEKEIHVGNLDLKRDFIDIEDVCHALILLADYGKRGSTYQIASGHSVSLRKVLDKMIFYAQTPITVRENTSEIPPNSVLDMYGSNEKIKKDTGWTQKFTWNESISRLFL